MNITADTILRNSDDAWEFMHTYWEGETTKRPDTNLNPVPYKKSVLHDFLEGEEMTLLAGDDGNYYTVQDRIELYGDYTETEFRLYGMFSDSELVKQHIRR